MINRISNGHEQVEATKKDSIAPDRKHCWISFGGNIGDVKGTFDASLALLSLHPRIELGARSGLYSTAAMGTQAGTQFLNSICGLTTELAPKELLRVLQAVEDQLGRVRDIRWGPRTLDLDVISYGDEVIHDPELTVPHPGVTYRRFVLDPLVEIAPQWRHCLLMETAGQMLERLMRRPLKVELLDLTVEQTMTLAEQLYPRFPDLQFVRDAACDDDALPIRLKASPACRSHTVVDLRHSPGCLLEQLTSAFTVIFDAPCRISDW